MTTQAAPKQAITRVAPKGLTFEDRVKQVLRTLAAKLSEDLAPAQLTQTYQALADWTENFEALRDNAKKRLLKVVAEKGVVVSDAGSKKAVVEGWILEARPGGAVWDEKKVMALLAGKWMPLEKWMTTTVKYAVDEVKLGVAIETKKLTEAEVNACKRERSFSLQPPRLLVDGEEDGT
jgi:hypothetical protein